ncbi:MAG: hypothetical protein ACLUKN_12345 [Bacilli bacterium]
MGTVFGRGFGAHKRLSEPAGGGSQLKFRTLKRLRYVLHFISHGKIKAEIADFSISLGNGEDFYPAMPNAPRYGGDLGKLPAAAQTLI